MWFDNKVLIRVVDHYDSNSVKIPVPAIEFILLFRWNLDLFYYSQAIVKE